MSNNNSNSNLLNHLSESGAIDLPTASFIRQISREKNVPPDEFVRNISQEGQYVFVRALSSSSHPPITNVTTTTTTTTTTFTKPFPSTSLKPNPKSKIVFIGFATSSGQSVALPDVAWEIIFQYLTLQQRHAVARTCWAFEQSCLLTSYVTSTIDHQYALVDDDTSTSSFPFYDYIELWPAPLRSKVASKYTYLKQAFFKRRARIDHQSRFTRTISLPETQLASKRIWQTMISIAPTKIRSDQEYVFHSIRSNGTQTNKISMSAETIAREQIKEFFLVVLRDITCYWHVNRFFLTNNPTGGSGNEGEALGWVVEQLSTRLEGKTEQRNYLQNPSSIFLTEKDILVECQTLTNSQSGDIDLMAYPGWEWLCNIYGLSPARVVGHRIMKLRPGLSTTFYTLRHGGVINAITTLGSKTKIVSVSVRGTIAITAIDLTFSTYFLVLPKATIQKLPRLVKNNNKSSPMILVPGVDHVMTCYGNTATLVDIGSSRASTKIVGMVHFNEKDGLIQFAITQRNRHVGVVQLESGEIFVIGFQSMNHNIVQKLIPSFATMTHSAATSGIFFSKRVTTSKLSFIGRLGFFNVLPNAYDIEILNPTSSSSSSQNTTNNSRLELPSEIGEKTQTSPTFIVHVDGVPNASSAHDVIFRVYSTDTLQIRVQKTLADFLWLRPKHLAKRIVVPAYKDLSQILCNSVKYNVSIVGIHQERVFIYVEFSSVIAYNDTDDKYRFSELWPLAEYSFSRVLVTNCQFELLNPVFDRHITFMRRVQPNLDDEGVDVVIPEYSEVDRWAHARRVVETTMWEGYEYYNPYQHIRKTRYPLVRHIVDGTNEGSSNIIFHDGIHSLGFRHDGEQIVFASRVGDSKSTFHNKKNSNQPQPQEIQIQHQGAFNNANGGLLAGIDGFEQVVYPIVEHR
jgi:hypothetical protein